MNENNSVPDFLAPPAGDTPPPPLTKEQGRQLAQLTLDAAIAALNAEKKKVEGAQQAKAQAQAILDAAKPNIMLAEAGVMTAKAHLLAFGSVPKEKTGDNPSIFEAVKKVLGDSPKQLTVLEITEALKADGIESNPDNLKAYLSRWSKTGSVVAAEKANKFEPARYYLPPTSNGTTPAFLTNQTAPPAFDKDGFPEDFPGRVPLEEAGYSSPADLVGKTQDELTAIPGIGKGTAGKILAAV